METNDFDLSPQRRNAAALLVLSEGGRLEPHEKARLEAAMWEGWRRVMCIRFKAVFNSLGQPRSD